MQRVSQSVCLVWIPCVVVVVVKSLVAAVDEVAVPGLQCRAETDTMSHQ